ncbi:MAG: hypothetical protein K2Q20_00850 [Phycisphaerales bacterium]|nr:hypothetical protein [Phycisphaerales bacterium]
MRGYSRFGGGVCGAAALAVVACAGQANAYLGSFTPADGYLITTPWVDVSYFNSGQFGANAGGGSVAYVAPDSGLWSVDTGFAGGIYSSWAARTAAMTTVVGNVYPASPPISGNGAHYVVGNHPGGRTDNSALAIRNDTPNNAGPIRYNYKLDSYDFGGVTPSTITSGVVSTGFFALASPAAPINPGTRGADKFTMSFKDSSNSIGLQWGYAADNEVTWRAGSTGPWTYTGIYINSGTYDGVDVKIDLSAGTFGIDYFVSSSSTWLSLVATGTPLGAPMTNLSNLGWQLEDGLPFGSFATKNFFDDFKFVVPAPGASTLLGGLALLAARRRRR